MPFWRKKEEEPVDSQAERLRKFRNMYATQYGSKPTGPVKEVGEPIQVQTLCTICSEPMATRNGQLYCPAAEAEPVLHEHLKVALQNWRSGQVTGKVVGNYNKTIGLMRQALKRAVERDRGVAPNGPEAGAPEHPKGLPAPVVGK